MPFFDVKYIKIRGWPIPTFPNIDNQTVPQSQLTFCVYFVDAVTVGSLGGDMPVLPGRERRTYWFHAEHELQRHTGTRRNTTRLVYLVVARLPLHIVTAETSLSRTTRTVG